MDPVNSYYKSDRFKAARDLSTAAWRERNPHYYRKQQLARNRFNYFRKTGACPAWVNREALFAIYYNCPEGYQVDHIVPINHPLVSGLHAPANLQYLPTKVNRGKSNCAEYYGDYGALQALPADTTPPPRPI